VISKLSLKTHLHRELLSEAALTSGRALARRFMHKSSREKPAMS